MSDPVVERIRFLFQEARDHGADTDAWDQGPDVVDLICDVVRTDTPRAVALMERARDPRWSDLQWYLRGFEDEQRVLFDAVEVQERIAQARREAKAEALVELAEELLPDASRTAHIVEIGIPWLLRRARAIDPNVRLPERGIEEP